MGRHPKVKITPKQVSKVFAGQVFDKPDFLDELATVRGEMGRNIIALRDTLLASPGKTIVQDIPTFTKTFGRYSSIKAKFLVIKQYMRNICPEVVPAKFRVVEHEGKVYFWINP